MRKCAQILRRSFFGVQQCRDVGSVSLQGSHAHTDGTWRVLSQKAPESAGQKSWELYHHVYLHQQAGHSFVCDTNNPSSHTEIT